MLEVVEAAIAVLELAVSDINRGMTDSALSYINAVMGYLELMRKVIEKTDPERKTVDAFEYLELMQKTLKKACTFIRTGTEEFI